MDKEGVAAIETRHLQRSCGQKDESFFYGSVFVFV